VSGWGAGGVVVGGGHANEVRRPIYRAVVGVSLVTLVTFLGFRNPARADSHPTPVTVGARGDEPLVVVAPDGTLYVSALQFLYRSVNGGRSWRALSGPPLTSGDLAFGSDSSIAVDATGLLYFTFQSPSEGSTIVCTSADRGTSWSCLPALAGTTDRPWLTVQARNKVFVATNPAAVAANTTAVLESQDDGKVWTPFGSARGADPGLLVALPDGGLAQAQADPDRNFRIFIEQYAPSGGQAVEQDTGLEATDGGLPSLGVTADRSLYAAAPGELARRIRGGAWSQVPVPTLGYPVHAWVAVDRADGHVGVIYYYTTDGHTWSVGWSETRDAEAAWPHWTQITVERDVHTDTCTGTTDCPFGTFAFSGDFISAIFDHHGHAHLVWMRDGPGSHSPLVSTSTQRGLIRYAEL
jgi:hypothetical protein